MQHNEQQFGLLELSEGMYEHLKSTGELALPFPQSMKFSLGERLIIENEATRMGFSALVVSLKQVAIRDYELRDLAPVPFLNSRKVVYRQLNELSEHLLKPEDVVQVIGLKKIEYSLKELKIGRTRTK